MTARLSGFEGVDHPAGLFLARPEVVPWVRYVLEGGETLHAAAASDADAWTLEGRAPVHVIPAKSPRKSQGGSTARWAVRRFARGGRLLPTVLGDRYLRLGPLRPVHETQVSEEARRRGIPTPRIIASAAYFSGLYYRADLVTEYIAEATDLVEALFDTTRKGAGGAGERLDALRASAALIRRMAEAGLRHGDLHAGNILLQWEGSAPSAFILDLDRARIMPEGRRAPSHSMVRRLRRSLRKWEGHTGLRLSEREWQVLSDPARG